MGRQPMTGPNSATHTATATEDSSQFGLHAFWYIACESHELTASQPLARTILDERIVLFRDEHNQAVALRDRCMHRSAPLSKGSVRDGCIQCPYHGWTYNTQGQVVSVPCEEEDPTAIRGHQKRFDGVKRNAVRHDVCEQENYVYVRLHQDHPSGKAKKNPSDPVSTAGADSILPFSMPCHKKPGYKHVRLQNRFDNSVVNCAENFIDIPHTVFVHPGIFRKSRRQKITATASLSKGQVHVTYKGETDNLGWFRIFLNPSKAPIEHEDHYIMPNVTMVEYRFGPKRHLFITSQSVPINDSQSLVYTDLTFDYGIWTWLASPIIRWQGQKVIDQDVEILAQQMENIKRYGDSFAHTAADTIHLYVEQIWNELLHQRDPRLLDERTKTFSFWV